MLRRSLKDMLAIPSVSYTRIPSMTSISALMTKYKKIIFTIERYSDKGLPFLDTLNTVNQDGSIQVSMYRKKKNTDRYLHFDSHHPSKHKAAVVHTLAYRKESLLSDETSKRKEQEHLEKSLLKNCYPEKFIQRHKVIRKKDNGVKEGKDETKGFAVLPYLKGTTERVQRILQQHNIKCCIKPDKTLRQILSKPKDPVEYEKQSGVVFRIPCGECSTQYIDETGRALRTRRKEHEAAVRLGKTSS
ncbi:hypothetical protein AC249_AIPGENE1645 [Exaiptasia diaphana]|nr:hypothetical protein AC249_AIPGENE1645 [Exaiptasia diaphana]